MDKTTLINKIAEEIAQAEMNKEADEVYATIENDVLTKLAVEINEQDTIDSIKNEVLNKLAAEIVEDLATTETKEASAEEMLDEAIYQYLMNKEAKGMNPGLRAYLDKKKAGKGKEEKKEVKKEAGKVDAAVKSVKPLLGKLEAYLSPTGMKKVYDKKGLWELIKQRKALAGGIGLAGVGAAGIVNKVTQ